MYYFSMIKLCFSQKREEVYLLGKISSQYFLCSVFPPPNSTTCMRTYALPCQSFSLQNKEFFQKWKVCCVLELWTKDQSRKSHSGFTSIWNHWTLKFIFYCLILSEWKENKQLFSYWRVMINTYTWRALLLLPPRPGSPLTPGILGSSGAPAQFCAWQGISKATAATIMQNE